MYAFSLSNCFVSGFVAKCYEMERSDMGMSPSTTIIFLTTFAFWHVKFAKSFFVKDHE